MTPERLSRLRLLQQKMMREFSLPGDEYWEMLDLEEEWERCVTERRKEEAKRPLLPPE